MKKELIFIYNIGDIIIDDVNDIVIIERTSKVKEYIKKDGHINRVTIKEYKCHCNKCNNDFWISEHALVGKSKLKCKYCTNQILKQGFNDIATLRPDLVPYFLNIADAKENFLYSEKKVYVKCPVCGNIKLIRIANLVNRGFSCSICSDNISYPNKFLLNLLLQLNICFEPEKRFEWCHFLLNNENKIGIYDFYIPSLNIIIEMDGGHHYRGNNIDSKHMIDLQKNNLASENNIKIIRINCDYKDIKSRFEFIKNNVVASLDGIFNLENVDWIDINKKSCSNLLYEVCNQKNNNHNISNSELANLFHVHPNTIIRWLEIGRKIGLCNYTKKQVTTRQIICLNNGMIFKSAKNLQEQSLDIFGVFLNRQRITDVCKGLKSTYKGYSFLFYKENN